MLIFLETWRWGYRAMVKDVIAGCNEECIGTGMRLNCGEYNDDI